MLAGDSRPHGATGPFPAGMRPGRGKREKTRTGKGPKKGERTREEGNTPSNGYVLP